ncbi:ribonuclease H2 subunit C [Diaphorina citri]|uniref:Ribonuclease H2 subunit C n=1 Tax=Diaphorina citri TaxID=121845 RepID=A0A1S3DDM6_DIACI|nr:ribonuclease H2 subunit C [Diaphorina citri]
MSITLNINTDVLESPKTSSVHSMPFYIDHDGPANVSKYFSSYLKPSSSDNALDASFRGLPLKGTSISVPDGFKGLIFTETNQHQAEDDERNFFLKDNFNKITYWNYDKLPSKNDAIVSALDWIHISQAVSILVLNQQW